MKELQETLKLLRELEETDKEAYIKLCNVLPDFINGFIDTNLKANCKIIEFTHSKMHKS